MVITGASVVRQSSVIGDRVPLVGTSENLFTAEDTESTEVGEGYQFPHWARTFLPERVQNSTKEGPFFNVGKRMGSRSPDAQKQGGFTSPPIATTHQRPGDQSAQSMARRVAPSEIR